MLKEELENRIPLFGEGLLNKETTPFVVDDNHLWGHEVHVVNEPEYCCKLLVLDNTEYMSSVHFHAVKKETLIVVEGEVVIEHFLSRGELLPCPLDPCHPIFLLQGGKITITQGELHRFRAIGGPAVILEISTHDDPEDNYKIVSSQKV